MCSVKLHTLKTSLLCTNGCRDEVFNDLLHFCSRHGTSTHLLVSTRAHGVCANEFLWRATAGVMQLNDCERIVLLDAFGQSSKTWNMHVVETTQLARETLTHCLHMRRTCHRETKATLCTHRQPAIFLVRENTISSTLRVRQRRQHETVLQ